MTPLVNSIEKIFSLLIDPFFDRLCQKKYNHTYIINACVYQS